MIHLLTVLLACSGAETPAPAAPQTLTLGAYTTPREALDRAILPGFAASWAESHGGAAVTYEESYQGSGAQARAVAGGYEADVVLLSMDPDVDTIRKADLMKKDAAELPNGGIVTNSIVVLAVRPGNPKGIADWNDLADKDVEVLTPNVRTSGGARWNVMAMYGAARRGHVPGVEATDAGAEALLGRILDHVTVMDKGARESMTTFQNGVGDVAITYENEVFAARAAGIELDYVVPSSTIQIDSPVALVDTFVDKHGRREVAEAFVAYLFTPPAQKAFADHGFRPVDPASMPAGLPQPADLFTVEDLGGWAGVESLLFAKEAAYDRASAAP